MTRWIVTAVIYGGLAFVAAFPMEAEAQVPSNAKVLSSCGTAGYPLGFNVMTMDQTGLLCSSATGGGGGGGAVTIASGAVASGAYSAGSIASGAFASGALAVGSGTDGWNVTEGATTDAASTAGGAGSISAKLRLMTTQLATVATNSAGITATPTPGAITLVALDISTVTTGATAVTALNSGHRNKGGWIQNPSTASVSLCLNEITTASGTTSAGSLTCVVPGQTYVLTASTNAVSVVSSDSSHPFSGYGWN